MEEMIYQTALFNKMKRVDHTDQGGALSMILLSPETLRDDELDQFTYLLDLLTSTKFNMSFMCMEDGEDATYHVQNDYVDFVVSDIDVNAGTCTMKDSSGKHDCVAEFCEGLLSVIYAGEVFTILPYRKMGGELND